MAVELCHTGKPIKEVSGELGIRRELISRWRREFGQYQEGSFSGHGNVNMTDDQKEISRLKKELKDAQMERDILKKAVSIFSKGDNRYTSS